MTQQQRPRPTPRLPDPGQREQQWTPDGPLLPYPGRHPRKRSKLWLWITLGALAPVLAGLIAYAHYFGLPDYTTAHTVVYRVEADAAYGSGRTGTVTMQTEGGTSQGAGLLPMTATFANFHPGDFVYVSVQNGQALGSVTCRITVDGVVVSENTSTGGYTIATCQGKIA